MLEMFRGWFTRRFSDPNAVALLVILVLGFLAIYFLGALLTPVIAAIVIAYLLDWPVTRLTKWKMPRVVATSLVVLVFVSAVLLAMLGLLPKLMEQGVTLLSDMPEMFNRGQTYLLELPDEYPELIDHQTVTELVNTIRNRMMATGQAVLSSSFTSLIDLAGIVIYVVLVPLLIFFMLKDKTVLLQSFTEMMPRQRKLANQVWIEVNAQIINYVRGEFVEILIVGVVTFLVFSLFGLRYAALLGVGVGLSVLIPFIGAAFMTIPVALVAMFQFGVTAEFWSVMVAYGVIQLLDGNVLVPILFSEAVNLHPVSIIVAVLVFGGIWGFWGVFFAIPLATLVKAVVNALPSESEGHPA